MNKRWAFMRREDIPEFLDNGEPSGRILLTRWRILQTPWFGIFLHALRRPDPDRHLHDHPWSFISIVLSGFYIERRPTPGWKPNLVALLSGGTQIAIRKRWSVAFKRAEDAHRISELWPRRCGAVWTLILVGRHRRQWGFLTENGWVPAPEYFATTRGDVERLEHLAAD